MSVHELLLVVAVLSTLLVLRFGLPLAITGLVCAICHRIEQPRPEPS